VNVVTPIDGNHQRTPDHARLAARPPVATTATSLALSSMVGHTDLASPATSAVVVDGASAEWRCGARRPSIAPFSTWDAPRSRVCTTGGAPKASEAPTQSSGINSSLSGCPDSGTPQRAPGRPLHSGDTRESCHAHGTPCSFHCWPLSCKPVAIPSPQLAQF